MATELLLIRHAPSQPPGHLYGRTDAPADVANREDMVAVRAAAGAVKRWISSPALRCRQTLGAICGGDVHLTEDARFWEQDFGAWEGLAFADVPDLGNLAAEALAEHRPPGGESFVDVCDRVRLALTDVIAQDAGARIAIVAHAGVVRAAIAMALGAPAHIAPALALAFDVRPLSLTTLRVFSPGAISIVSTNWRPACR